MKKPVFIGCATALATPFTKDNKVDYAAVSALTEMQIENGVSAVVVCATTGECPTLTDAEFEKIVCAAVQTSRGRVPIIAGVGRNCTEKTLHLSLLAEECGASALLAVNPYYNKSTQEGIAQHFEYIADRVHIPIILYNVPSRTGASISADTYARLAAHPNIYGTKEASGDLSLVARIVAACPPDFTIYSGNDDQVAPICALGGRGVISTCSNVAPREMAEMCRAFENGAFAEGRRLQIKLLPLIDALFAETNPIPLKWIMGQMGLLSGVVRMPLCQPSSKTKEQLQTAIREMGLAKQLPPTE